MKAVILFAHGSRDPLWREPMEAVARRIAARGVAVRCAYLELQDPGLPAAAAELVQAGATSLRIVPMFLGAGRHVREDLPKLVGSLRESMPSVGIELRAPVGEDARVLDLLADVSLEGSGSGAT